MPDGPYGPMIFEAAKRHSLNPQVVAALIRAESSGNPRAVSHKGARGLMQLMPATAKATARINQIPYSEQRLVTDPLYNATLGAHNLGELLGGLRRSYLLTFAGYNAGAGRALEWVRDYGDPRGGAVDPVDWVERIPFDETRDYVERVSENLGIYRARLSTPEAGQAGRVAYCRPRICMPVFSSLDRTRRPCSCQASRVVPRDRKNSPRAASSRSR